MRPVMAFRISPAPFFSWCFGWLLDCFGLSLAGNQLPVPTDLYGKAKTRLSRFDQKTIEVGIGRNGRVNKTPEIRNRTVGFPKVNMRCS